MSQANRLHEGKTIKYTPSAAVVAGTVVVSNSLIGVPPTDIAADGLGSLDPAGLFSVVKANGTMDFGNPLFWDADGNPEGGVAGTGCLTTTATGNTFFGLCARDAAADDERVVVYKVPSAVTVENSLGTVRADPGAGGAIPVAYSGSVQLVTLAGETRTLAAPTFVGQMLGLSMKTDGGNCVVTASAAVNETGNNTLTFDNPGEFILLIGIEQDAAKVWRVAANDGVGLTTV